LLVVMVQTYGRPSLPASSGSMTSIA
jgi:hypothetical protein